MIVFETLAYLQSHDRLIIYAYVLMENHLHMVASADDLAKELASFKSYSARRSIDYYRVSGNQFVLKQLSDLKQPHRVDRDYQFWQEGVHPKRIFDERMMRQKIEYIHHNPIRRGYVEEPEHWRYSSARNYAGLQGMLEVCKEW
jgi:REP element-mobilizing transposase RayT